MTNLPLVSGQGGLPVSNASQVVIDQLCHLLDADSLAAPILVKIALLADARNVRFHD